MSKEFIPFIKAVGRGEKLKRDLTYEESCAATHHLLNRTATDAQLGAFLIAQRVKGEAVAEIDGIVDTVRQAFITPLTPNIDGLLDLAVPYDGKAKTAQLAPAIALTLATLNQPVLLHGAQNIPTKSGVTAGAVFDALGLPMTLTTAEATTLLERTGVSYIDAAQFAPKWDALTPLRHDFGLRTVLNTTEKLFNPANAPYQISGFFHGNYIDRLRGSQTGAEKSFVIQGEEGSVEVGVGKRTPVFATEKVDDLTIDPKILGLVGERVRINLPSVLSAHVNLNHTIIAGNGREAHTQVALTVAVIFSLLHHVELSEGFSQADKALRSGAVAKKLEAVVQ